jgi:hypothetical protein
MEIQFCDICNESVPQADLDGGRAQVRKGRIVCAHCEAAMSPGVPTNGDALAAPAGSAPPPVPPPALAVRGSALASAAGVMGVLLGSLAIVLLAVGAVLARDWLDANRRQGARELARLEARLAASERSFELDVAATRRSGDARGQLIVERIGALRSELSELESQRATALDGLAEALAALRVDLARLEGQAELFGTQSSRIDDQGEELAALRSDIGLLAESLLAFDPARAAEASENAAAGAPPAWLTMLEDLEDENPGTRWFAVDGLGKSGDPEVVPYLVPMLDDDDIFVRMAAARSLGELRSREAVPGLIDALEDDEAVVRDHAAVALRAITGQNFKFEAMAGASDRARRVKAWREWWEKNGGEA